MVEEGGASLERMSHLGPVAQVAEDRVGEMCLGPGIESRMKRVPLVLHVPLGRRRQARGERLEGTRLGQAGVPALAPHGGRDLVGRRRAPLVQEAGHCAFRRCHAVCVGLCLAAHRIRAEHG